MSYSPILGNPKPNYPIAATGIPAVNYTLTFYEAGTSTLLDTYDDSTGATANDNPLSLNSRGEPSNASGGTTMIYGPDGTPYKVVLKDAAGAIVWTMDDVYPGNQGGDEWINPLTATRTSTTTFTVTGDQTADFHAGRRIKCTGGADRYATITSSTYTTLTTVTVENTTDNTGASATLHASMDTVYISVLSFNATSADSLKSALASILTDDQTEGFHLVSYPAIAAETAGNIEAPEYPWGHVFRYIPQNLHTAIIAGTNTTDLNSYIINAAALPEIYLPDYEFLFSDLSALPSTLERIHGAGTLKLDTNAAASGVTSVFGGTNPLKVEGITIDLNKANQTGDPRIYHSDLTGIEYNNCTIKNGYTGVRLVRCSDIKFTNNTGDNNTYYTLVLYGCTDFVVADNIMSNNGYAGFAVVGGGLTADSDFAVAVTTNNLTLSATTGATITATAASAIFTSEWVGQFIYGRSDDCLLEIIGYTSTTVVTCKVWQDANDTTVSDWVHAIVSRRGSVTGNVCDNNTYMGINIDAYNMDIAVSGNTCTNSGSSLGDGIIVQTGTIGVTVSGNTCNWNYRNGITHNGSSKDTGNVITGNQCMFNGHDSGAAAGYGAGIFVDVSRNFAVTGNVCNHNYDAGIWLKTCTNGTVTGNMCGNRWTTGYVQEYGIVAAGADPLGSGSGTTSHVTITGNQCNNNYTSDYRIDDTGNMSGAGNGNNGPDLYDKAVTKTANYTLTTADAGNRFNNSGAAAVVTFTLPAADATGLRYVFLRTNATHAIRVDPDGTDNIRGGGAGKYISLDTNGADIELYNEVSSQWEVRTYTGTTSFEP